jgi:hypothetical protein
MQKEELFKNPLLGRDDLAAKVGTNRSYLLDIIKNCSEDKSITDFINGYRLTQCFCHADEKSGIIHHRNWGIIRLQFPQFFQSGFSWEGTE